MLFNIYFLVKLDNIDSTNKLYIIVLDFELNLETTDA